ncbi:MAG: hypothetical protein ACE361_01675 [Aureliella sp.]
MSTGEITLALVDDAAKSVGNAAEQHTTSVTEPSLLFRIFLSF